MKQAANIRRIGEQDFEFVYKSLCDLENEVLEPNSFKEIFFENINNRHYLYLLAECNNEKAGFITFHTQQLLHHCGLVGEIQEFYIVPHFRAKGIGRQLMDNVMSFAEQQQLKSIEVTSNNKRIENIAVYENLGFALTHNKFTIYR